MAKKKPLTVQMMYCDECNEVLIQFNSYEREYYTAVYKAGTDGIEFVDRSDGDPDYRSDYHCPLCDESISFCSVDLDVARVLEDYAEENRVTHFPFKLLEGLGLDEITVTEAKKILLQKELEESK